jgi:hypothetical protein
MKLKKKSSKKDKSNKKREDGEEEDQDEDDEWVLRRPCYNTEGMYPIGRTHEESICVVAPLIRTIDRKSGNNAGGPGGGGLIGAETDLGQSLQVASVDESGFVQIWVCEMASVEEFGC